MGKLQLFTIFHLNIAYSSIAAEDRQVVIRNCYWPLLRLIEMGYPIAIEATGYTLEIIKSLDSEWIDRFVKLLREGKTELIGSGYMQIIGPLVPEMVNFQNIRIGEKVYKDLLETIPSTMLLNEQAYSLGLADVYTKCNISAIVTDWDNPYRYHRFWDKNLRYKIPNIRTERGSLRVLWSNSVAFQKFQRYVFGEYTLTEYLNWIKGQKGPDDRVFSLYTNDAEIFNYRPGRFHTETKIEIDEWKRIEELLKNLSKEEDLSLQLPSQILSSTSRINIEVELQSPVQPIPVKKQEKYNLARWALAGRSNREINTACFAIYEELMMKDPGLKDEESWKSLCYLWGSDFRTHIELKRWEKYLSDLSNATPVENNKDEPVVITDKDISEYSISRNGRILRIENERIICSLNCFRGLAIKELVFKQVDNRPLIGSMEHGSYDNVAYSADFFTGHTIFELFGRSKVTDLNSVDPQIKTVLYKGKKWLSVSAYIQMHFGAEYKEWLISLETSEVTLREKFDLKGVPACSMRTGQITIIPDSFDRDSLYYECNNGGERAEKFALNSVDSIGGFGPLFYAVSAGNCLGNTTGEINIGDAHKQITFRTSLKQCAALPVLQYKGDVDGRFFFRVAFSFEEFDDTRIKLTESHDIRTQWEMNITGNKIK